MLRDNQSHLWAHRSLDLILKSIQKRAEDERESETESKINSKKCYRSYSLFLTVLKLINPRILKPFIWRTVTNLNMNSLFFQRIQHSDREVERTLQHREFIIQEEISCLNGFTRRSQIIGEDSMLRRVHPKKRSVSWVNSVLRQFLPNGSWLVLVQTFSPQQWLRIYPVKISCSTGKDVSTFHSCVSTFFLQE